MTELKNLSSKCELDNLQDSLIKYVIVCGTNDNSLHETLLREYDLTLSKAITEETRQHAREVLRSQSFADIDKIFKKKLSKSDHKTRNEKTRDFIKTV